MSVLCATFNITSIRFTIFLTCMSVLCVTVNMSVRSANLSVCLSCVRLSISCQSDLPSCLCVCLVHDYQCVNQICHLSRLCGCFMCDYQHPAESLSQVHKEDLNCLYMQAMQGRSNSIQVTFSKRIFPSGVCMGESNPYLYRKS